MRKEKFRSVILVLFGLIVFASAPFAYSTFKGYMTWYRTIYSASCRVDGSGTPCTLYKMFGAEQFVLSVPRHGTYLIWLEANQASARESLSAAFPGGAVDGDLLANEVPGNNQRFSRQKLVLVVGMEAASRKSLRFHSIAGEAIEVAYAK